HLVTVGAEKGWRENVHRPQRACGERAQCWHAGRVAILHYFALHKVGAGTVDVMLAVRAEGQRMGNDVVVAGTFPSLDDYVLPLLRVSFVGESRAVGAENKIVQPIYAGHLLAIHGHE